MPLIIAPLNKELKVIKIFTEEKVKKHLQSLGITVDSTLTILSHESGSVILVVKDGRLALDKDIATKIYVV